MNNKLKYRKIHFYDFFQCRKLLKNLDSVSRETLPVSNLGFFGRLLYSLENLLSAVLNGDQVYIIKSNKI